MRVGWKTVPLWSVVREQREVVEPSDLGSEVIHYSIPSVDATGTGRIEDSAEIKSAKLRLRGGEVLISKLNPRKSRVVHVEPSNLPLVSSTEFVGLHVTELIDRRFLGYLLQSEDVRQQLDARVQSVTRSHQRVDSSDIVHLLVSLPLLEDQRRIADFLDAEFARIDRLVALRGKHLALLDERLDSVRDELLANNQHASPTPLMHLTDPLRPIVYGIVQAGPEDPDGVPYIKTGDLPELNPETLSKTSRAVHAQFIRAAVHPGDIIIAMRASIGTMAVVPQELPEANLTQGTARVAPAPDVDREWLFQVLQTRPVKEQYQVRAVGSTFRTLNIWDLRRIVIPGVPAHRQVVIAKEIRKVVDQHQRSEKAIRRQTELLVERRQALITAAVTGKIDMSTANGRGIED